MTLYLIGLGLGDEKDITARGLDIVQKCSKVFLEDYTSKLNCPINALEKFYGKNIVLAAREMIENNAEDEILDPSMTQDVALLVVGDPLAATTHADLLLRAKNLGVKTQIIHNASVMSAIAATGLQLYKFGKTTSLPFPEANFEPMTAYDCILQNKSINAHTLILLDIKAQENRFMSIADGVKELLKIEKRRNESAVTEESYIVACARLGHASQRILYGKASLFLDLDLGPGMQCIIVPAKLHFVEEELLAQFSA